MAELGAYGLRIHGLPDAELWMQPQDDAAPVLRVMAVQAEPDSTASRVDAASADIALLDGGRLTARRGTGEVRFALPVVPAHADLLHPYLAPGAALAWQWAGREALHCGGFGTGAGAVLLFGEKGSGKSATLAWLAENSGVTVMADDLAVIDGDRVLAGPRSIDLRSHDRTGAGQAAVSVRDGERIRVTLPPAPACLRITGCVVLRWGSTVSVDRVPPSQRPGVLAAHRSYFKLEGDPRAMLELAARPMLTLTRPRTLEALPAAASALLERFG